jgi:hypothetical protein
MAIKAGMTIAQAIAQLTKGFIKVMGRKPEALEKIKIKQEAAQKVKDLNKVVDMEGKAIDPSKGIMGGKEIKDMGLSDEEFQDLRRSFRLNIAKNSPNFNQDLADRIIKREIYQDLSDAQRKDFLDNLDFVLKNPRDGNANGGRIGYKDGPDQPGRRNFMKIMGGLAALPFVGKFFKTAEVAAPVAKKAVEAAGQVPSYFFDLVAKIKLLGEPRRTPSYKERVNEYQYTGKDGIEYELIEDLDTGEITIQKDKIGVGGSGDESFDVITDRTELRYKKPKPDEGDPNPAEEYEEFKVEFDSDGTAADASQIDEISKKEIIKEVTEDAPSIKKASGGIARMLGE